MNSFHSTKRAANSGAYFGLQYECCSFIIYGKDRLFMPTKIDFIGGNTKRCLMAMALPMIAAMFLNMMYNLVDSLWIGNLLGETAYAALTNSTPIILILTSVAMGATNGVSILIS